MMTETAKQRTFDLFGLTLIGAAFYNFIKGKLSPSVISKVAQPIFEGNCNTPPFLSMNSAVSVIEGAAEATTENMSRGLGGNIASIARGVFHSMWNSLSWSALAAAGVIGTLGANYLFHRFWKSDSGIHVTNTNNNQMNINIHFAGVSGAKVEQKDANTVFVTVDPPDVKTSPPVGK